MISTSGCNDLHNILSKYAVSRRISTPVFRRYSTLRSFSAGNSVSFAAAVPSRARDLLPGRRADPCYMRKNRPTAWLFKRFPMEGFSQGKRRSADRLFPYEAASSIFSMEMPYPLVGSFTSTCVTAPTSLPSCRMGLPDMPWTMPPVVLRSR